MTDEAGKAGYIQHLHAFRGFAILTIVGAHSWSFLLFMDDFASMPGHNTVYSVTETLFHGSTLYFALISGLLFSLILRSKGWRAFYRSKALHVFTPYAIVSLFFIAAFWPFYVEWFESVGKSTVFWVAYLDGLLKGSIQLPFWYIPILMALYAFTPVVDMLLRQKNLAWLAVILIMLPLAISRTTVPNLLSGQTVVYFLGAYSLGMFCGMYYDQTKLIIEKYRLPIWVAAVGCSAVVLLLFLNEYEPAGHYSLVQTLVYVQKLAIAALVLHYFAQYEATLPKILWTFGSYAFAIYFLHFFMVNLAGMTVFAASAGYRNAYTAAGGGLFVLVTAIALSILVSWLLKLLFKRRSRMIIGA